MTPAGGRAPPGSTPTLRGREAECAALDVLIAAGRDGQSGVLVVHGEAGVGKTALLGHAVNAASGFRLLHVGGVESEIKLAFAALHQLCAPLLHRVQELPPPQRSALDTVFGRQVGAAPDRFLVGLAVLSLLSQVSGERPLLCVVDDAQWLDRSSAQALGFVARRLRAEPVVLLFAGREPTQEMAGLPDLAVKGLRDADARLLLTPVFGYVRDERIRERIVAEARGNPLALLEFPRRPPIGEFAARASLPIEQALSTHLEDRFLARVGQLSEDGRLLLLLAAAEPVGDTALVWRAAQQLGIDADAAAGDDFKALLSIDDRLTFRHPLVRSAVYRGAPATDKRRVHLALSAVTDPQVDPDRRAWHMASAAVGPDESVAGELERSAGRAQARGGLATSAAFLARSVALTEDAPRRVGRALAAALISMHAGDFELALRMVSAAEEGAPDETEQARATLLRGQVTFASLNGRDAVPILMAAAGKLRALDLKLARETYLEAWGAAAFAGASSEETSLVAVSTAAASLPPAEDPGPADILLDGLVTLTLAGRVAAAPILRRAIAAFTAADAPVEDTLRWGWLIGEAPSILWDEELLHATLLQQIDFMRRAGALARVSLPLSALGILLAWRGDFSAAAGAMAEVDAVAEATNTPIHPFGAVFVAALRGREDEATALLESTAKSATAAGQGLGAQHARWASAILFNGLGRYDQAFVAAQRASAEAQSLHCSSWALPELIEASVRSDHAAIAVEALGRLAEAAAASGTDWVRGVDARCRALVTDGDAAEICYREAVERLSRTQLRPELARANLLYGEWLRRQGRRTDAREQLRTAHDMFAAIGMEAFAERARRELLATGERVRRRTVEASASDELTEQERQIAMLVRDGLSNPEVGTRLFLSPRTVEWHLRKIFEKLSISSRKQLRDVLPDPDRASA